MNALRMSTSVYPIVGLPDCSLRSSKDVEDGRARASPPLHDDHRKDQEKKVVEPEPAPAKVLKTSGKKKLFPVTETVSLANNSVCDMLCMRPLQETVQFLQRSQKSAKTTQPP